MRPPGDVCPVCGRGRLLQRRLARSSDPRSAQARYPVGRCDTCGSEALLDAPDDADTTLYVGGSYARPPKPVDRVLEPLRRVGDRSVLRVTGALPDGARVLDVGAGDGRHARLFGRRGWTVVAIDPLSEAAARGDVVPATFESVAFPAGSADLVLLWHVLEHLPDPETMLRRIRAAVRPDGALVLSVPRLDSLQARLGGDRWFHQDVPRHRLQFTKAGATELLRRTGFAPVTQSRFSPEQGLLGMVQTILNRITREQNVAFRALKNDFQRVAPRDVVLTVLALVPAALVGVAAELAASVAGRGGTLVIRATPTTVP